MSINPGDATFPHFEETTILLSKIKPEGRFKDWTNGTHTLDYICEVILPHIDFVSHNKLRRLFIGDRLYLSTWLSSRPNSTQLDKGGQRKIYRLRKKKKEAEFRDPRFYPSSCESLPSIATIGGLIEAARLGTSQAELKDGTTRAPIVRLLSCQRAMKLKPS
ncbi:hypothetical protein YC2023_037872 [Brassica napus]